MQASNKLYAGGVTGALTMIIVWALHAYTSVRIPAEIAIAIQTVVVAVIQYLVPNTQQQVMAQLKNVSDDSAQKA